MSLYDSYQLSNSRGVKEYAGSVVPDLIAVSQEQQKRYDQTVETNDYTSRFLNSVKTLDSDTNAWKEVSGGVKDQLNKISSRPDLENATRDASMLARNLPDAYAPFAENVKRQQAYVQQIDDQEKLYRTSGGEKGMSPERAAQYKQASMVLHSRRGGMQKDETGKYIPNFTGVDPVNDLDKNKFVDEAMKGVDPHKIGFEVTNIDGQWLKKNGKETTQLTPAEIDKVMGSAFENSGKWKSYTDSQKLLGTYATDYSKIDPSTIDPNSAVGQYVSAATAKGIPVAEALRNLHANQIESQERSTALQYAHKYARNDIKTSSDLNPNQVWKWNKDDADAKAEKGMLQLATTMTLGGAPVKSAGDFNKVVSDLGATHDAAMTAYDRWNKGLDDRKVKIDLGGGRVGYKNADGKTIDITGDANDFRRQIKDIDQKKRDIDAVDEAAKRAAGFSVTPALKKQAQAAYDEAYKTNVGGSGGVGGAGHVYSDTDKRNAGSAAYDAVIQNTPAYKKYQDELSRRMTGTTMGSDLFAFRDEKTVKNISEQMENLISGLGLKDGVIPLQTKDGSQITADQWNELKGNIKAIGVTATGDPGSPVNMVIRAFKDVKGKKTAGEDMILKVPYSNIENIAGEGMDTNQKSYLSRSSGLAASLNNPTRTFNQGDVSVHANTNDPRSGWTVKVKDTEKTLYTFKDILDFIDEHR